MHIELKETNDIGGVFGFLFSNVTTVLNGSMEEEFDSDLI